MRFWLLGLVLLVACSGQMCATGPVDTGVHNACSRTYYSDDYRVGFTPPNDSEPRDGDSVTGVAFSKEWTWTEISDDTLVTLVVLQATQENTLAQFREIWLNQLEGTEGVTVEEEEYKTLTNGEQGWYVRATSESKPGQVSELILTTVFGKLTYVGVAHADVTEEQQADMTEVLMSICADVP